MIIKGSSFTVVDNTGAKKVVCIQPLGRKSNSKLNIGNKIIVAVKKMENVGAKVLAQLKVKKSDVCLGIIVKVKKPKVRTNGMMIKATTNSIILLNFETGEPAGTRVNGFVYEEISRLPTIKDMVLAKDYI